MSRILFLAILGAVSFIVAATSAVVAKQYIPEVDVYWPEAGDYRPAATSRPGPELVMVFVGSPNCVWSTADRVHASLERLKIALQRQADSSGYAFAAVGVAKTTSAVDGVRYLQQLGGFDEIISGRGAVNSGVLHHVYGTAGAAASTPQVLVITRHGVGGFNRGFVNEELVLRKVGSAPIDRWAEAGGTLPLGSLRALDSTSTLLTQ